MYDVHVHVRTNYRCDCFLCNPEPKVPLIAHPTTVNNRREKKDNVSKRSRSCQRTEQQNIPVSPLCIDMQCGGRMYMLECMICYCWTDQTSVCACIIPFPCVWMSSIFISVSPYTRPYMRDMKKTFPKHISQVIVLNL